MISTSLPASLLLLLVLVPATPLLCRVLGRNAGFALAAGYLGAAALFAPAGASVLAGHPVTWTRPWVPAFGASLALRADGLGVVFTFVALLIGAVVLVYATRYLDPVDAHGRRRTHTGFYVVMATFTAAMVGLVLADDLLLLFTCWEVTSIASFLLVGQGGRGGQLAALRTMFLTFLGGLALLVAVGLVVARTGSTSVSGALAAPIWGDTAFTTLVAVLVLLAGFTKSAQFPFHVWLPDAMSASTPVSAYLHAAAVVKAGIFLLMRFTPAFHATPAWTTTLLVTGLFTAALGAYFALQQTDLKKLMAYSTVSQLGLVVATIGVGTGVALAAATVHVVAHALFKSGLFMMVGVIDHAAGTRDVRRLPPLWRRMPISFTITCLGAASMAGIPPMLGFVSKESLFGALLHAPGPAWVGWVALAAAAAASVLTFAYCVKIVFGGFVDGPGEFDDDTHGRPAHPEHARHFHAPDAIFLGAAALPILAGLPLGLAAGALDQPVAAAVHAAHPASGHHPHLALWHGVTPELLATLAVFALGAVVLLTRRSLWPRLEHPSLPTDGAGVIAAIRTALRRVGVAAARLVAADHPARHLAPIVGGYAAIVLVGTPPLLSDHRVPPHTPGLARPLDAVLLVLVAASVALILRSRARLGAVLGLSSVGILVTVQLVTLGAPDVALTQLLVEALTIIVIMLVLQKLPLTFGPAPRRHRALTGALAITTGLAAGAATWLFSGHRERSSVAEWFLRNTYDISGGHNVVNVILVEFRALDTMGELTVLGMTGIALVAVLSSVADRDLDPHPVGAGDATSAEDHPVPDTRHAPAPTPAMRPEGSTAHRALVQAWPNTIAPQLMLRIVVPLLVLVSAALFWRGHQSPGGGFIAALVGSAVVGLIYLSTARDRQIGPPRLPLYLIGGGVTLAVLTGLYGLVALGSFLAPRHGTIGDTHLTSAMAFDAGVYAAVLGLVMLAFNLLGTSENTDTERTRERADEAADGEIVGESDLADAATRRAAPDPGRHGDVRLDTGRSSVMALDGESRARAHTTFLAHGTPPAQAGREPALTISKEERP